MHATLTAERGPSAGSSWTVRAGQTVVIGRGPGAQVTLPDEDLLPRHAAVMLTPAGAQVVDLGGPAGTLVNGRRLAPRAPAPLAPGDEIALGGTTLRVEGEDLPAAAAPRPAAEVAILPPSEFEAVRELGRGGMGRVVAVRRRHDGRLLAAKVLHGDVPPEDARRFAVEGRVAARLRSPFLVELVDLREHDGRLVLLMDLVPGPSLAAVLARGPLHVADALRVGEDLGEALAAVHAANVVHRDVKPSNVLLDPRGGGAARLTDFGIAKDLAAGGSRALTHTGQGLGTLHYLAPEQLMDAKRVGPRADLYALGATLFACLTGAPPFDARTPEELMRRVVLEAPPRLAAHRPDAPPELAAVVDALLVKEPDDRRATARQVVEALRASRLRRYPQHRFDALFGRPAV